MSFTPGKQVQPYITPQLREAYTQATEGRYDDALGTIQEVKELEPRNIYVIALQKQFERLRDLPQDDSFLDDQRAEIVQLLPAIIEHALESAQLSSLSPHRQPVGGGASAREAALANLKRSYLQRADEYLEKGDYEHALAEVHRVYIIDPSSTDAQNYEKRIAQIVALQFPTAREHPSSPRVGKTEKPIAGSVTIPATVLENQESWKQLQPEPLPPAETIAQPKRFLLSRNLQIVVAAVALLVIVGTLYLVFRSSQETRGPIPEMQEPSNGVSQDQSPEPLVQEPLQTSPAAPIENMEITPPVIRVVPPSASFEGSRKSGQAFAEAPAKTARVSSNISKKELAGSREELSVPRPDVTKISPIAKGPTVTKGLPVATSLAAMERLPSLIKLEMPEYPEVAYRNGIEGKVKVRVLVSTKGKPLRARIVESTNPVFNEPAIKAVMKSEFSPGVMPSGPVTAWIVIPFTFTKEY